MSYTLGLAQRTPAGGVKYFHTDHLGTTQAMTNASQTVNPRIVSTAFGEVIDTVGTVDTRYQYVGKDGYESFNTLPFLHVGARWYDPASGRFLQRDPIGLEGGVNVYSYVRNRPAKGTDPDGLRLDWETHKDGPPPFVGPLQPAPPRPTVPQLLAYDASRAFLFVTGGRKSWLDNPKTVKRVQFGLKVLGTAALWCTPIGPGVKAAHRGAVVLGWTLEYFELY